MAASADTFLGRKLRIGVVDYLNAYPLWGAMEIRSHKAVMDFHSRAELVPGVPSFLAAELQAGRVDAACISSVEYLRHPDGFTYHPALCIAATNESKSIRLFVPAAGQPFASVLRNTKRIYTDISSRSSVAQLRIVLRELGVTPLLEEVSGAGERIRYLKTGEALLAIGDTGLMYREEPSFDLQSEYFGIFGRGFVYALWVCRADLQAELEPVLSAAYAAYQADVPFYLEQATLRFGFSAEFTREYLTKTIHHGLTPERNADLAFFSEKLHELN